MGVSRAKPIGFFSIFFIAVLILVSCGQKQTDKLTIAAAANMQFAVAELTKVFSEQTGIECETVTSSSGKLTAQIIEGAPFDVLLSADMKFPEELYKRGLTLNEPLVYAYGNLILWTLKPGEEEGITMRIWNLATDPLTTKMHFNHSLQKVASATHVETEISTLPFSKNVVSIRFNQQELKTFCLRLK